jgi:hypothetical protein
MAARRKAKRVRRRKTFSIVNGIFAVAYANVISAGLFGTNLLGFFLGYSGGTYGKYPGFVSGSGIGIKELLTDGSAFGQIIENAQKNLPNMLIQSVMLGITERVFKSVMRRPLANVNRNIVKPLLGAGVRL